MIQRTTTIQRTTVMKIERVSLHVDSMISCFSTKIQVQISGTQWDDQRIKKLILADLMV
jgi:hypothetical protein